MDTHPLHDPDRMRWYTRVGDGEWMCIACNDSRTRDSLGVVRHDDTRVHNDARAHQLMNLGTHRISKPALVGPANRPDDLANILSAIDPGSQEHQLASDWNEGSNYPTSHRDSRPTSPTTAHVIPEEAVPEMPDTPEVQLGKRQMDSSGGNDIESWKRTKVHVDDNMWFPWADKISCTVDILTNLPHSAFSRQQLDTLLWLLQTNNVSKVPTKYRVKQSAKELHAKHGIRTFSYDGALGNKYYVNSISDIIAQEMANPQVRRHLRFYPEDSGKARSEYWQGTHWRDELDPSRLTPMAIIHNLRFFIFEPCLLKNGSACVPVRWFHRGSALFAKAWTLRAERSDNGTSWLVEKYNEIEVHQDNFLISFDKWDVSLSTKHLPHATQIHGVQHEQGGDIFPWTFTDPKVGNKWRVLSCGKRVYAFPIWLYCDDTSGNMSKRWNKHNSYLFTVAGLPQSELHKEYNVHFLCTSNVAPPLEMLDGILDQLEETWENGIWAWDCEHNDMVLVIPFVSALLGDNPMQSEFACHIGPKGKFFCRVCLVCSGVPSTDGLGTGTDDPTPQVHSGDEMDDNESVVSDAGSEVSVDVGPRKKKGPETMAEMTDRVARFVMIGEARKKQMTIMELETMIEKSKQPGTLTKVRALKTDTGIKDKFLDHFLESMAKSYRGIRGRALQANALDEFCATLPDNIISPVWRINGLDPHSDTPVEILHTILLGFVKYFWRDVVQNQLPKTSPKRSLLEARLSSVNTAGLGCPPLSGSTLVNYAGSLTGRDFRVIAQVAPFVLVGIVPPSCYNAWVALSSLIPLVWEPRIPDIDDYVERLGAATNNFLATVARWTPQWFNKPKFHYLLHLGDHVRRFGPAVLFATESFESFNSVIRAKSVHSNRQAPSRDIAFAFAHANRVRSLLCGGKIRVRLPVMQDTQNTPSDDATSWQCVSVAPLLLLRESHVLRAAIGGQSVINTTSCGYHLALAELSKHSCLAKDLAESDGAKPQVASQTHTGKHFPTGFSGGNNMSLYATYLSFKLVNGDTCSVGSWVFVASETRDSVVICAVKEILSVVPTGGKTPERAEAVLLQCGTLGDHAEPYLMPSVSTDTEKMLLLAPMDILCVVNVQHNCHANKCLASGSTRIRQERQLTQTHRPAVSHKNPQDLLLNTARMRDAIYMEHYRYTIDPEAAQEKLQRGIHEGVQAEVDKRKKTTGSGMGENSRGSRGRAIGRGGLSRCRQQVIETEESGEE